MHLYNPPLIARLVQRVTDARWRVLLVAVLVVVAIGTGVARLTMNADYKVFFSKKNPQLAAFDALQNTYTKDDNILIALEPADGNVFSRGTLVALESLVAQSWRVPFATRVDAVTNFQLTRADGDDLYVGDLVQDAASLSDADLATVRATALAEPQLVRRLVSPRGDITALNITLKLPGERIGAEFEAINAVRANLAEFRERHPDIRVYTSGVAMLFAGFSEAMQRDMGTLVPLTFLAALLVVGVATRSVSGTAGALVVVVLAVVTAMGAAGYLGIQFTAPIASVPTMIMTLGVADSVHVLSAAQRALVRGSSKRDALRESLRLNAVPVILTSVTTAIGFLSMNFSEVPPFRDLGNMTAIGILAAGVWSLTVLPALLLLLPFRAARRTAQETARRTALLGRLGEVIAARHRLVVAAGGVLALAAGVLATRNELSDEMVKYLDPRVGFRQDTDYLSERLTGIYTIEYSVGAGRSGGITDPVYLRLLQEFRHWLESQPNVTHVSAFDEVAKRVNRAMHGDSSAYYRLPDNGDEAAQYLLLYEMSLPYGLDLNNQINVDKSATRVVATVQNLPSEQLIALTEAGEAWLRKHGPAAAGTHGISMPLIFAHLVRRQIRSMLTGTVWSVLLIAGLLALVLRSVRYGAIGVVAISVPIVAAFGVWALVKGQITGGLAIVTGMTLGIIDDDVVHFISKYRVALEEHGLSAREAVRHALSAVGWDLIVTSAALIAGFLVLAQSSFGLFFDLAKLTAITIAIAVVFNLVFLPALLVWLAERRERSAAVASPLRVGRAAAVTILVCGATLAGAFGPTRVQAQQSGNPAPDASAGGLGVAREADRRDSGWRSSVVEVRMTLTNAHGQTSERRMRSALLEVPGDGDRTLVVFDEPADVKGSAVLTYSHASSDDDQWLYLPAVRRVKRIASSNKAGPFMGSEFAFEDLSSQEVEKYTYRLVGEDTLGGVLAFVVDRDPVDAKSGYTRQRVWYDQRHYRPLKIDYYDRKDALLKTLTYERYQAYGAFWRARAQLMVNHQTGKRTRVEFGEFRLDAGLTPADFEVARLGSAR